MDGVHELAAEIGVVGFVDLAHTCGAGDVDLGEIIADDIQSNEDHAFFAKSGADLLGDPAVALGSGLRDAFSADCEIAAKVRSLGDSCEDVGGGFSIDQQKSLIAEGDLRDVLLDHRKSPSEAGDGFDADVEVGIISFEGKDRGSAHAIEGLEDGAVMLLHKVFDLGGTAGDQRFGGALWKPREIEFFVGIAEGLRFVEDQNALCFGTFEGIRGVDVFHIKGGIFAHQDRVKIAKWGDLVGEDIEPMEGMVLDSDLAHTGVGGAVFDPDIALFHVPKIPATTLCGEHHRKGRILGDFDTLKGVHDDADLYCHARLPRRLGGFGLFGGWLRQCDKDALLFVDLDGEAGDRSRCGESTRRSIADIEGGSMKGASKQIAFEPAPMQRDIAVRAAIFDAIDLPVDFTDEQGTPRQSDLQAHAFGDLVGVGE